jgi:hypothetical protein
MNLIVILMVGELTQLNNNCLRTTRVLRQHGQDKLFSAAVRYQSSAVGRDRLLI